MFFMLGSHAVEWHLLGTHEVRLTVDTIVRLSGVSALLMEVTSSIGRAVRDTDAWVTIGALRGCTSSQALIKASKMLKFSAYQVHGAQSLIWPFPISIIDTTVNNERCPFIGERALSSCAGLCSVHGASGCGLCDAGGCRSSNWGCRSCLYWLA